MLTDTHCHLDFDAFNADRAAVIERAVQGGVARMLTLGVNLPSSRAALALANAHPAVFAAVGVHPNDALSWNEDSEAQLLELARSPRLKAIGEIGLDDYRDHCPLDIQHRVLERQLDLAARLGLPVVLHVRNQDGSHRMTEDMLALLETWTAGLRSTAPQLAANPGVLHSYSDNLAFAERAFVINFCIGISGPVTYPNAHELRAVVRGAPLERLLIETDAPFLAPQAQRGKRNEPLYVKYVLDTIAQERGTAPEQLANQLYLNAERLFHW